MTVGTHSPIQTAQWALAPPVLENVSFQRCYHIGEVGTYVAPNLRRIVCRDDQDVYTKDGSVHDELDEELERCLRDHASHPVSALASRMPFSFEGRSNLPRTEMIHLAHTSIYFPTMMRPVRLKLAAGRAIRRPAILLANKDIFCIEALQAEGINLVCLAARVIVYTTLQVHVHVHVHSSICLVVLLRVSRPSRAALATPALPMLGFEIIRFGLGAHSFGTERQVTGFDDDIKKKSNIGRYNGN